MLAANTQIRHCPVLVDGRDEEGFAGERLDALVKDNCTTTNLYLGNCFNIKTELFRTRDMNESCHAAPSLLQTPCPTCLYLNTNSNGRVSHDLEMGFYFLTKVKTEER